MPDLKDLPNGTSVFVDTNIFDLHFRNRSLSCTYFLERIQNGEINAYVNIQVLSDLLHNLMLAEACAKSYINKRSAGDMKKCLKKTPGIAPLLTEYQSQFEDTLAIGIKVLPISKKLLIDTKFERATYSLMTGDSLHIGTMNRHSTPIHHIVTHDADFAHVSGIIVWEPSDVTQS